MYKFPVACPQMHTYPNFTLFLLTTRQVALFFNCKRFWTRGLYHWPWWPTTSTLHPPRNKCLHQVAYWFFFVGGPHLQHMEVPRRGVELALLCQPTLQTQQCQFQATSSTYITDLGNARFLTHWAEPGIEPATSWILVKVCYHWTTTQYPPDPFSFEVHLEQFQNFRIYCSG